MTQEERRRVFEAQILPRLPFDPEEARAFLARYGAFEVPASTKDHGACPGGWFDHSLCVTRQLVLLTERNGLEWQREEGPYVVGFFHDACKLDSYSAVREDEGRPVYAWNGNTLFKGHGEKSVMMLASLGRLTEEEAACIRYHMGAFTEKELWGDYTRAVAMYPNVLWTHTADMIATHICGK